MTEPQFSGPPTPEELFAHIIRLARDTGESQKDAQLVRQEVRTALANFERTMKAILTKTEAIQKSYAPDSVKEAVRAANGVLDRFEAKSEETSAGLTKQADRVSSTLLVRTMMWSLGTAVCLVLAGWISLQIAPNPIEISDRRAQMRSLQEQIATANQEVENLKGRLFVGEDGRRYAKYTTAIKRCVDQTREETCALYVLIP